MKASRISAAIYGHKDLVKTIGEDIEKYEKKTGDGLGVVNHLVLVKAITGQHWLTV